MTTTQDLIDRLRSAGADGDAIYCWARCTEAADALKAAQAEIERLRNEKSGPYFGHYQDALGKISRLEGHIKHIGNDALRTENAELRARLAELVEQKPVAIFDVAVNERTGTIHYSMENKLRSGDSLYAAAGASPQPSQELQSCSCRWDADDNRIATCTRHQGWLDVVGEWADRAKAAESKLAQPTDDASAYAKNIAIYLWKKFYKKEAPTFEVCDGLYDVLSQIDNMVTGLPMPHPPHTPRVGDLRTDVVNPMAAWPFETEASVEARQRAAFEAKGV